MLRKLVLLAASPVLAGEFCVVKNTSYERCHYYSAQACQEAAERTGGVCIYKDAAAPTSSAAPRNRQAEFNSALDDFGNTMMETGRAAGEAKRAEESQEMAVARFRADLGEKAARFDKEFPGEPNPFRAELERTEIREKAAEEKRVAEEKKTRQAWIIVGAILGGIVLLAAANSE